MKHYVLAPVPYFCAGNLIDIVEKNGGEVISVIPVGTAQISAISSPGRPQHATTVSLIVKSETVPHVKLGKNEVAVFEPEY